MVSLPLIPYAPRRGGGGGGGEEAEARRWRWEGYRRSKRNGLFKIGKDIHGQGDSFGNCVQYWRIRITTHHGRGAIVDQNGGMLGPGVRVSREARDACLVVLLGLEGQIGQHEWAEFCK